MSNCPHDATPAARALKKTSPATKLLQAAALAAVLVPLGSVAVETADINCVTSGAGGGCTATGSYVDNGQPQSNTWWFYRDSNYNWADLIYTFEIAGTPTSTFGLDVQDRVTSQGALVGGGFLANFPGLTCVPTYADANGDNSGCGLFDVAVSGETPAWEDGYWASIVWWPNNDPLSQPPQGSFVTILQAKDGFGGLFTNQLTDIWYDEFAQPGGGPDPAIGGKGNSFSTFGVFAPEPSSVILLGTGLAGVIYRVRRRRRQP